MRRALVRHVLDILPEEFDRQDAVRLGPVPVQRRRIGIEIRSVPARRDGRPESAMQVFERTPESAGKPDRFAEQGAAGPGVTADQDAAAGRAVPAREVGAGERQIVRAG